MFCQVYSNIFNWNQGINELKRVYLSSYSEICIFFFSFRFYFLAPCVIPHFLLSLQTLGLQSQLITPSLLEKWHTYPRDCKLAEIDCRVLEISKLAYLVITFYSENSNKKKGKCAFIRVLAKFTLCGNESVLENVHFQGSEVRSV